VANNYTIEGGVEKKQSNEKAISLKTIKSKIKDYFRRSAKERVINSKCLRPNLVYKRKVGENPYSSRILQELSKLNVKAKSKWM
jgi:hypothetical protein